MKISKEIQWIIAIVVIILILRTTGFLGAAYITQPTYAKEDTYVDIEAPDTNYIESNILKIGKDKWIYLKFEDIFPAGKQLDQARLCIYANSVMEKGHINWQYTNWGTEFSNATNTTAETSLTWNTRITGTQSLKSQYIDKIGLNCEILNINQRSFSLVGTTFNLEAEISSVEGGNAALVRADYSDIPPPPQPKCGDGIKQANEECDDGNNIDKDGCSATCQIECKPWETKVDGKCGFNRYLLLPIGLILFLILIKKKNAKK